MSQETSTELAVSPPKELQEQASRNLLESVTIDNLVERVNLIKEAMRRCMVEGQHHGTIPGCKKPSLWKPGAELICTLFQLGARYPKTSMLIERENGHFVFTLTCELFHIPSGRVVGEGVGGAATMEYRYRVQTEDRFTDHGQPIKAKYTPYDFYNTVLKMAKKRAMVDAVLTATGASEIWTQDTEDNPDLYRENEAQPSTRKLLPKAPTRPKPSNGNGGLERITGFVSRTWPNDYQGKHYWFARLDKGQQIQTTDAEIGARLLAFQTGQAIEVMAESSPKPGKFYLKSIETPAKAPPVGPALPEDDLDTGEPYEATP